MSYKYDVRGYLELTVGKLILELVLNSSLVDSFHPACIQIRNSLKDCFVLEKEDKVIYLKPFQDIFVTSYDYENSSTCVWIGGSDYYLEDILDLPLLVPRYKNEPARI